MSIYKSCDIRGIYGEQWDETDARQIGAAVGRLLAARQLDRIYVGGDFRHSTAVLKDALIDGLLVRGIHVVDVGHSATPVVNHAARHAKCPNVAVVTASHNPGKYNGIKLLVGGMPALPPLIGELRRLLEADSAAQPRGTLSHHDPYPEYKAWVVTAANSLIPGFTTGPGLTIVLDTMGGAFTNVAPRILTTAGHQVISLREQLDPAYETVDPNPADDRNLQPLVDRVVATGADLGVALDGDGDRVILVTHDGKIVRPEQVAALLVKTCFPGCRVVYDLKCASLVRQTVHRYGGEAIMQPSGYGFIRAKLLEENAAMGVEASGHHFFQALDGGDDGLFTGLLVMGLIQQTSASLAELISQFTWPEITPDIRVAVEGSRTKKLERIADTCGGMVSRLDGIRSDYDGLGWALARVSITEPVITLRFEGGNSKQLHTIVERFLAGVPSLREQVLELIDAGHT